jgi:hypothetical protein
MWKIDWIYYMGTRREMSAQSYMLYSYKTRN